MSRDRGVPQVTASSHLHRLALDTQITVVANSIALPARVTGWFSADNSAFRWSAQSDTCEYKSAGPPSVHTITCTTLAGGAPEFPAETGGYSTITGRRIRFLPNTITVALRNSRAMIWSNTTVQLKLAADLPVEPTTDDRFVIEGPDGASFDYEIDVGWIFGWHAVNSAKVKALLVAHALVNT